MTTTWLRQSQHAGISGESQKQRARELLRSAWNDGLCSLLGYSIGIPNLRTRVYELRDDDGLLIQTVRCDLTKYHAGEKAPAHVRWIWLWNGNPHQLRLLRAI